MSNERLFVPLAAAPFEWFRSGRKRWELRRVRGQYTERHVRPGRLVELRRGYSTPDSIWGDLVEVVTAPTLEAFFARVPFAEVTPHATSQAEAIEIAKAIIGDVGPEGVIGFRVAIRPGT